MDTNAQMTAAQQGAMASSQQRRPKSQESSSGRSKPRASYACLNCRQRKIKCAIDPVRKKCSSCRSLQVPCVISKDGDRRKLASREQISSLQDRLRYLEAVVAKQGHVDVPPNQPLPTASTGSESHSKSPQANFPSGTSLPSEDYHRESILALSAPREQQDDASHGFEVQRDFGPLLNSRSEATLASSVETIGILDGPASAVCHSPSSNERDSPRLDVDDEGDQPRFYGPSSQRYIHDRSVPRDADLHDPPIEANEELNTNSGPVRNLLLQTFWKVQPLSQAIIDQMTFEMGRNSPTRSQYYSEFLENSILACATRMSTSPGIRALGPKYAEQASLQITQELQNPNVATLQGFLLLSDFEATRGRDRLGYIYSGIGCRMVFDLGLQESCSELINRGKMSPSEGLSRHILFLGAFVYDKLWSLYLGRPSSIPLSHLASAQRRIAEQGWDIPATLQAWAGLAADISEVTDILNSDTPLNWKSLDGLVELDARIHRSCANLPASLRLNDSRVSDLPASAYGLNMQFRGIRIVLHRLLSKGIMHNTNGLASPHTERLQRSRNIMRENAVSIARMASVYEQIFGIENVITVMLDNVYVAAALLVSNILRQEQHDSALQTTSSWEMDARWLRCLADMLRKAQKHYPVTSRMRYTLCKLVAGTSLSGIFGSWASDPQSEFQASAPPSGHVLGDNFMNSNFNEQSDFLLQNPYDTDQGLLFQDMVSDPGGVYRGRRGLMDMTNMGNMMTWILSPTEVSKS